LGILGINVDQFKTLLEKYVDDMKTQNVEITLEIK